jgi:hypothetical protein
MEGLMSVYIFFYFYFATKYLAGGVIQLYLYAGSLKDN